MDEVLASMEALVDRKAAEWAKTFSGHIVRASSAATRRRALHNPYAPEDHVRPQLPRFGDGRTGLTIEDLCGLDPSRVKTQLAGIIRQSGARFGLPVAERAAKLAELDESISSTVAAPHRARRRFSQGWNHAGAARARGHEAGAGAGAPGARGRARGRAHEGRRPRRAAARGARLRGRRGGWPRVTTCSSCEQPFELVDGELRFYRAKGLDLPRRCPKCRERRREDQRAMSRTHGVVGKVFSDRGFIEAGHEDFYVRVQDVSRRATVRRGDRVTFVVLGRVKGPRRRAILIEPVGAERPN